jgi:hypothetical protein
LKARWKIVIVAIIVAVTITIASLFYLWWASPGADGMTPAVITSRVPVIGGWQINIVSVTKTDIPWDQINVQLNGGTDSVGWSIKTADLDGGFNITAPYAAKLLGTLSVTLTVTDNSGSGFVSGGDYFTFTANPVFSSTMTYTVVLIYEPTGDQMSPGGITFTGV